MECAAIKHHGCAVDSPWQDMTCLAWLSDNHVPLSTRARGRCHGHGPATSQAVSRVWDMHSIQSDMHVTGSIGRVTLDEGCCSMSQIVVAHGLDMAWQATQAAPSRELTYGSRSTRDEVANIASSGRASSRTLRMAQGRVFSAHACTSARCAQHGRRKNPIVFGFVAAPLHRLS